MDETTIRLPDETVNYLERLDYEIGGLEVLHTHALKAGTPLEKRMEIRREFQETFAEYQMAKNEMWAEYAPRFPGAARWWVDFQSGELHVEAAPPQSAEPTAPPQGGSQGCARLETERPLPPPSWGRCPEGAEGVSEVVPHA